MKKVEQFQNVGERFEEKYHTNYVPFNKNEFIWD